MQREYLDFSKVIVNIFYSIHEYKMEQWGLVKESTSILKKKDSCDETRKYLYFYLSHVL